MKISVFGRCRTPLILAVLLISALLLSSAQAADFPEKPLKFVVYTNPGGLIDISARKIAKILEDEHVATPVVVENKKGAGGLVALQHVLRQPADGHTVFALTSSVVSKAVEAKQDKKLRQLEMLARVVEDYECLIVKKGRTFTSLEDLNKAVKDPSEKTIWAGPAVGGTDHLFALKYWNAVGGEGTWIPYKSGGEAVAALLGGHADVYVGNPQDVRGRKGLEVLAVAAPERVSQYPDVPTFKELGLDSLTGESLWRGFAVRRGTPPKVKTQLTNLLKRAAKDESWTSFVTSGGASAVFESGQEFEKFVVAQMEVDRGLFQKLKDGKS